MEESSGGEGREWGGGQPQQQRGKGKRRVVDAGRATPPEPEDEEHPLAQPEIITNLMGFVDDSSYLYLAVVCRCWNDAYRRQLLPMETAWVSATTTRRQLQESFQSGLERTPMVCVAAARHPNPEVLAVALEADCPLHKGVAIELARRGRTGELKAIRSRPIPCPLSAEACDVAAEGKFWGLMRWLLSTGCTCTSRTMAAIAANAGLKGNVGPGALLQLAMNRGAPLDATVATNLARRGDMENLTWVVEELGCPTGAETMVAAAGAGDLEMVEWLHARSCPLSVKASQAAAEKGHLGVLRYLKEISCPFNSQVCAMAALGGHAHVIVWARQVGEYWKARTSDKAAEGGHLDLLRQLQKQGCPRGTGTTYEAAKAGRLDLLKWLRSPEAEKDKCPWNARVCKGCAEGGHLEILKWARGAGCPWDFETTTFAAQNGHLDILKYASEQGCPMNRRLKTNPEANKHAHVRRWLRNWDDAQAEKENSA